MNTLITEHNCIVSVIFKVTTIVLFFHVWFSATYSNYVVTRNYITYLCGVDVACRPSHLCTQSYQRLYQNLSNYKQQTLIVEGSMFQIRTLTLESTNPAILISFHKTLIYETSFDLRHWKPLFIFATYIIHKTLIYETSFDFRHWKPLFIFATYIIKELINVG